MASVASAAVAVPFFAGLKAVGGARRANKAFTAAGAVPVPRRPRMMMSGAKASLKDAAVAAAARAVVLSSAAGSAMAVEVLLGSNDGGLVFVPSTITVSAGEEIVFKNNAGFPHNVVFDEDEVPSGVDASKISMPEDELLNAAGDIFSVKLTVKGDYSFYCAPHQGAGMVGKITVN